MSKKELETQIENEVVDSVSDEAIDEATAASDSLSPNSKPVSDPKSRVEIMKSMIGAMAEMPKKDLVKWFDQTQSQFGPNKDYGVSDNSGKNKSSIDMKASAAGSKGADVKDAMPKLSVKEDVDAMFEGHDLSEEFKEKASTIFEAAVSARIIAETARLEEEFEEKLNETAETFVEDLTDKIDTYFEHVVESWMKDNEVAIETSLRNELVDDFINSLKGVFAEHYIDVPQEKLDVLEALSQKVEELEARLDETISENAELKKIATGVEKDEVFDSVSEGLALSQVERFRDLSEGIEFDGDLSAYERKLNIIKETYFTDKKTASTVLNEEVDGEGSLTEEVAYSPEMKKWAQAISRTVKK